MKRLEFWYEFASTYSYLAAMRIEDLSRQAGVEIAWRPFLLGPLFKAQGWDNSPFNLFPVKGRYMVRDISRMAADRGLPFRLPSPFPTHSVKAARLALVGVEEGWVAAFTKAVFLAEFADGLEIADAQVLSGVLAQLGLDAERISQRAETAEIKQRLRDQTEEARTRGLFGAPTFIVGEGELFWGDDRLEQALAWAGK